MFQTEIDKILESVNRIDPVEYGRTRNFLDGSVTRLSPYISRGVISTKFVYESVLKRGFRPGKIKKFIQELAWRDYFQTVWTAKLESVDKDLKQPQPDVQNHQIPAAIINAKTGIEAVDASITDLYNNGYVHNHVRMYIASIACNLAKCHWMIPAKWFYFHLLDADWGSNALSWQWTAGAFSNKKYYANQENINRFCYTDQKATFLDVEYEEFAEMTVPDILKETTIPRLETILPARNRIAIDSSLPTLIYNFYNLDPCWKQDVRANRVLLLEPSHFEKYPVSSKTIDFILKLAANIGRIEVYTGEFDSLVNEFDLREIYFKEHPTARHYRGNREERDWLFPEIKGYFPSFFKYWNQGEKFLKRETLF